MLLVSVTRRSVVDASSLRQSSYSHRVCSGFENFFLLGADRLVVYVCLVVLIGDSGVGKSNLLSRWVLLKLLVEMFLLFLFVLAAS